MCIAGSEISLNARSTFQLKFEQKWIRLKSLNLRTASSGPSRRDSTKDFRAASILYDIWSKSTTNVQKPRFGTGNLNLVKFQTLVERVAKCLDQARPEHALELAADDPQSHEFDLISKRVHLSVLRAQKQMYSDEVWDVHAPFNGEIQKILTNEKIHGF